MTLLSPLFCMAIAILIVSIGIEQSWVFVARAFAYFIFGAVAVACIVSTQERKNINGNLIACEQGRLYDSWELGRRRQGARFKVIEVEGHGSQNVWPKYMYVEVK